MPRRHEQRNIEPTCSHFFSIDIDDANGDERTDMNNPSLNVWTHRLDPMRAEVRLRLHSPDSPGELRGRLMGPRCRFTTTIEVAYPFRPLATPGEYAAIVPDPSLWEPAKPFLYEGPAQWTNAQGKSEESWHRVCFRSLNLGPKGLLLNGKPLQLRGKELSAAADENELLELRRQGFNALLTDANQADISELADRLGFLHILRENPGDNGQETFFMVSRDAPAERSASASRLTVKLPGIARQADGTFTLA
jgi:hypothetical protein